MRFTMAQPETSCHPERSDGARTVVSAALCYYAPGRDPAPGEGRLARYTWDDRYAELREKLDALGRRLGGEYRVLVDANQHVDREGAVRAGVGFYGKNTLLITRTHGSWVVLGTLVTDARSSRRRRSSSTAARAACASTRARPARSTSPGRSTRRAASRTGRRRRAPIPEEYRAPSRTRSTAATSARTSARGTAASRSGGPDEPPRGRADRRLVEWLARR